MQKNEHEKKGIRILVWFSDYIKREDVACKDEITYRLASNLGLKDLFNKAYFLHVSRKISLSETKL